MGLLHSKRVRIARRNPIFILLHDILVLRLCRALHGSELLKGALDLMSIQNLGELLPLTLSHHIIVVDILKAVRLV